MHFYLNKQYCKYFIYLLKFPIKNSAIGYFELYKNKWRRKILFSFHISVFWMILYSVTDCSGFSGSLVILDSVLIIESYAFYGSLIIGNSVQTIYQY